MAVDVNEFVGFGSSAHWSRLRPRQGGFSLAAAPRDSRRLLRELCPARPGVYGMIDAAGDLIYVGKSKSLKNRLLTYLQTEPTEPKAGRIIEAAERLVWEVLPHELAALVRELELIRRWRPEYNVRGQPGLFRRVWLCLGRGPAPQAYLAPEPNGRAKHAFGPLPSKEVLREAVRFLNTRFKLRDCPERVPMVFADQLELFDSDRRPQCTRFELGTCPAPCAAGCTRRSYSANVGRAKAFLEGADLGMLERLERDMLAAAESRHFERAANLRDVWLPLHWLSRQLEALREARRQSCFVAVTGRTSEASAEAPSDDQDTERSANRATFWTLIRRGHVVDLLRAPRDERSAARAAARLQKCFALDSHASNVRASNEMAGDTAEDMEHMLLVHGWFRSNPAARQTALSPADALAHCQSIHVGAA